MRNLNYKNLIYFSDNQSETNSEVSGQDISDGESESQELDNSEDELGNKEID